MKVQFAVAKKDEAYYAAMERIRANPSILKLVANVTTDTGMLNKIAKDHGIDLGKLLAIRRAIRADKTISLPDGMDVAVEKTEAGFNYEGSGKKISVIGMFLAYGTTCNSNVVRDTAVNVLSDFMVVDKNVVKPIPFSANPDNALVDVSPIIEVAESLTKVEVKTRVEIQEQLSLNFETRKGSEKLSEVLIEMAPKASPLVVAASTILTKDNKHVKVSLPIPSDVSYQSFDSEVAEKVLYKANQMTYPSRSPIYNTAARHVYGLPFEPQHRKYADFLTDVHIPKKVKKVHLYTNDVVYAMALHNIYPELKVAIVGKKVLEDKEVFLSFITPFTASKQRKQDDTIMAIWVAPDDNTQASSKEKAAQIKADDESHSVLARKYKYHFRPMNVHAVAEESEYGLSCQVRKGIVIDGYCRGKQYSGKDIKCLVAAGIVHSYYFPFRWKALCVNVDGYPEPRKHYSTLNRSMAKKSKLFDFMSKSLSVAEAAEIKRMTETVLPVKQSARSTGSSVDGEEEQEEEEEEEEDVEESDQDGDADDQESDAQSDEVKRADSDYCDESPDEEQQTKPVKKPKNNNKNKKTGKARPKNSASKGKSGGEEKLTPDSYFKKFL